MTPDDIDRILSSEDVLEPSSGFAGNVMEAVRREAAAPATPAFPWVRFAIGLAASGGMAAAGGVLLLRAGPMLAAALAPLAAVAPELTYAAAALLAGLAFLSLQRLVSRL